MATGSSGCSLCGKVVEGAVGLTKAALGIGLASPQTIKERRDKCRACEHATRSAKPQHAAAGGLTSLSRCQLCGCVIVAKTRLAEKRCPDGRWEAVLENS